MNTDISSTQLDSDDMLNELIFQSLDKILGTPHQIISRDFPFTGTQPILALDCNQHPALIVFDRHDGGQALLTGLKILESIESNRAWLLRLHPELLDNDQHALRPEDIQLFILAPTLPPGADYLKQGFSQLHVLTFQPLLINGKAALLIEPAATTFEQVPAKNKKIEPSPFRTGMTELEKTEEDYFRNLNIMA